MEKKDESFDGFLLKEIKENNKLIPVVFYVL